ncbi:S1C family serine protease [Clostridium sp. WILCCON 0269]|uniref:S1C family serine protease n=1 Tax=Candidatus Clostridium eludens TaxID=3381663 RepID=A0ABW8SKS9_9CLOT
MFNKKKFLIPVITIFTSFLFNPMNVYASAYDGTINSSYQSSLTDIVDKNINAIALVEVKDANNTLTATASGCIITPSGELITNYHVIDSAYYIDVIMEDGTKYDVKGVLGYSKSNDLAILQLNNANNLPTIPLGYSSSLKIGQEIITIGSPDGLENTVSTGIISGLNRNNGRDGTDIQISAPTAFGSSGGALIDMSGQLIGITYSAVTGSGDLNFAIPINDVKPLLNVTKLTALSELGGSSTSNSDTTTTPTVACFPQLSDVPMPDEITYAYSSSNGKTISYYYKTKIPDDVFSSYISLLYNNGWNFIKYDINQKGNFVFYCSNGSHEISIELGQSESIISGEIH